MITCKSMCKKDQLRAVVIVDANVYSQLLHFIIFQFSCLSGGDALVFCYMMQDVLLS